MLPLKPQEQEKPEKALPLFADQVTVLAEQSAEAARESVAFDLKLL